MIIAESVLILTLAAMTNPVLNCTSYQVSGILVREAFPGHISPDFRSFFLSMEDEDGMEKIYCLKQGFIGKRWKSPEPLQGRINEYRSITDTTGEMKVINNSHPCLTADELTMVYVRNHTDEWEGNDLWIATRSSKKEPFEELRPITEFNTDSCSEAYPFINADGSRLYYTADDRIVVSEFNEEKSLFEKPDTLTQPSERPIVSCCLTPDEKTILLTDYDGTILKTRSTSVEYRLEAPDTIIIPEKLDFISSPSLVDNGELYLYASIDQDDYIEIIRSDITDWDKRARKKTKIPLPDPYSEGIETAGFILILTPKGDE
ncbi:hypothetical protein GF338_03800 [candidate division WOR-3 bacterium]|nr:hypothetical protein [candidate division WOR-3 bacterium]